MKTTHVKNLAGLRERPTYLELIDYIENNNDKIKLPDRRATFLRKSFYLSQLDGEGMRIQEQMQKQREARQEQEMLIHQFARDFGFQQRDIKNWLQGRGLVPVRRQTIGQFNSSTYEPSRDQQEEERNIERFMTPQGQRAVNVIRAGVQRQVARRRQTMYQSIATPLQSPRDEVRRSLYEEIRAAEDIAQEAADEGVPSTTLLKRAGGMLASGASAAGGMIASGASAAASATGSA